MEKTMDDSVRVCPYCGDSYQPEAEDYDDVGHEEKCDTCGETYIASDEITVTHYATPVSPDT